ncbi:MAG: BMP family protein [Anaerolineae bacterium]|nr:BMP family protein [Anaerolineae bacterium]
MIRRNLILVCIVMVSLVLSNKPVTAQQPFRVALVLPGSIADRGFNQSAYEGLKRIEKERGAKVAFSEKTPVERFERVYRDFADEGFNVIIGHGFEFGEVTIKVAPSYPNTFFLVTNNPGVDNPPANVAFIQPNSKDSAFLVGVAAGLATKSNVIGAIGGFDFPIILAQLEALRLGIKAINPKAELRTVYIGTFDDSTKGKEAAKALIAAGADVIYHQADEAGLGAIQAAQEAKVWAIGWGVDQRQIAPGTMLTTQIVDTGLMLLSEVKTIQDGKFKPGTTFFGLDSGVVGYAPLDEKAQAWTPFMDNLVSAIRVGVITVPFLPKDGAAKDLPGGWLNPPTGK